MPSFRRIALLAAAAPLALALAACGDSAEEGPPRGEALSPIAAPAGASWIETAATTPEGGNVIGNPEAPLKLVEYVSHTCGVCAAFSQQGAAAMEEYVATGVVSYEIRNQVHNPVDMTIAMLVRCGSPQAFHPLANQAWQNLDPILQATQSPAVEQAMQAPPAQRFQAIGQASGLLDFFAARGISRDQAMQCLADTAKADEIARNSQTQSDELGVEGTPTFFLNGARIDGTNWASVEAALQAAGARR